MASEIEIRAKAEAERKKTKPKRDASKLAARLKDRGERDKKRIEKRLKDIKILEKSLRAKPENKKMIAQLKKEIELIRARNKKSKMVKGEGTATGNPVAQAQKDKKRDEINLKINNQILKAKAIKKKTKELQ